MCAKQQTRTQRADEIRAHLDGLTRDLGWMDGKLGRETTMVMDGQPRRVRLLFGGARAHVQVQSNVHPHAWFTRSKCLMADVVVGKGYTRIGSEFIYH